MPARYPWPRPRVRNFGAAERSASTRFHAGVRPVVLMPDVVSALGAGDVG
ncbi:hypothetical protein [Nocardia sp. BMG51109]|nr:hypothetical protein [Nocardia sp. BMG51109]